MSNSDNENINLSGDASSTDVNQNQSSEAASSNSAASVFSTENTPDELINDINVEEESSDFTYTETIQKPNRHRVSNIIRYIIMAVASGVFIFCVIKIGIRLYDYKHGQDIYKDIDNDVYSQDETPSGKQPEGINPTANIDFDKLKAINPDVVGWVEIPSVGISYPIAQGEDNNYYLKHAINKEFCWSGSIFLHYANHSDFSDRHIYVYGHHMNDGSMFSTLLEYDNEDFYNKNKGNNYVYIYTPDCVKVYEVFAVKDAKESDDPKMFEFSHIAFSVDEYIKYCKDTAIYDTGVKVKDGDSILTLFTCQGAASTGIRHFVQCRLVETIEK